MPTVQGFVQSIDARFDGSIGVRIISPQAGNQLRTATLPNLDGDLSVVHRKLAQLGLLRDALSATLPVVIQYHTDEKQGDLIDQVNALPTRSIVGRIGGSWTTVRVLGLMTRDRGIESTADPLEDEADEAFVTVLLESGGIETYRIDLQRRYEATGHAILTMCAEARRQRRALRLCVNSTERRDGEDSNVAEPKSVIGAEWQALASSPVQELMVFVERIGRRTESFDVDEMRTVDHVWVSYRTAPIMQPDGDVSANGSFEPVSGLAWLHVDSPLVDVAYAALREGLQLRLGLVGDSIHSAEVCCPLASAARPVWVTFDLSPICVERAPTCVTVPTVEGPDQATLDTLLHDVRWHGTGWFAPGIWRIIVDSGGEATIQIDGKTPCLAQKGAVATTPEAVSETRINDNRYARPAAAPAKLGHRLVAHAFLDGLHEMTFDVLNHSCNRPFRALVYRIR